ncbi:guanine deaminase [Microvirgula curvata]|uniref:Guanine deaminase n=1 Tax=Microvirgula aerodenitrificans TaxID=57480 RepID=A0A2S0P9B6_9NEIS|nr:guanine deaminase [Microvirgula aerodenitrificans]AVY93932.1 guanine deaminase [Microvirgula aerodenitrificans]
MKTALRGAMLTFRDDPFTHALSDCAVYEPDAVIVMANGLIDAVGPAADILPTLSADVPVTVWRDCVLLPGFIDSHVHYPQTEMIGAHGEQLIDWLNNYTFVAEQGFSDKTHAAEVAEVFLREQHRNGVTASTVFCTVHPQSVDALFEAAARVNMRIMAGKVCMDRHAPAALLDTPQRAYDESKALIGKWHGRGRAEYVITPRFAPTSTPEQLDALGSLAQDFPTTLIQSHLAENIDELAWVRALFPSCTHYTDVYQRYGLLRPRALYGHGIHLSEAELDILSATGSAIVHCPTSNFFLGSGCFDLRRARDARRPVAVGLGTDLGAGTSFSILQTLNEAYKAAQFHGFPLSAAQAIYLATRGNARALGLDDRIGAIEAGMEADIAVLDLMSTPLIAYRMKYARDWQDALFIQMTLGDDRAIAATYIAGQQVHCRNG